MGSPDALAARVRVHSGEKRRGHRPTHRRAGCARVRLARTIAAAAAHRGRRRKLRRSGSCPACAKLGGVRVRVRVRGRVPRLREARWS